ncbi:fruit bromelain-like [Prunus yedoensis var. nudiflora]|uniref:Fruit bromelain-like n=1 Tax=Prunus yedoensis var. nudiflora TaxID=2094558 RepID=A0A314XM32_PRUYE|nr:fruit bromelain-like [Prunus yedoensis var. nudiflora]
MTFDLRNFVILLFLAAVIVGLGNLEAMSEENPQNPANANLAQAFEDWIIKYKPVYSSNEEKERRFAYFKKSFEFVENFNKGPKQSFTVGLTQFSDRSDDEMSKPCFLPYVGKEEIKEGDV